MNLYSGNYKRLLLVQLVALVICAFLVFVSPGVKQGLDIVGGTQIIVNADKPIDAAQLEKALSSRFELSDLKVTSTGTGARVQFAENKKIAAAKESLENAQAFQDSNNQAGAIASAKEAISLLGLPLQDFASADDAIAAAKEALIKENERFSQGIDETIISDLGLGAEAKLQHKEVGAALGKAFWNNAIFVTMVAFVLIIIVVFVFFREIVPSGAILAAAAFDMLGGLSAMALFGIPLSLASIPSLLMLIGYSIDTDILLTTRVLKKREGTERERAWDSLKTGVTMTSTAIVAVFVMMALAFASQIVLIFDIAIVLLGGMIADLVATWFMNAPVLLWYVEAKKKAKGVA
jgi:preprotein translocase subunit SecF